MDIDLYKTDFPGMYVTEDGFMVSESGDIYDQEGNLLEEDAVMLEAPAQIGAVKTIKANPVRDKLWNGLGKATRYAQNHKGKAALGVAGVGLAAYGAKKVYNHFKNKKKAAKKKAANESFDLYETEMPGIYVTEDGYFVDTDGSLYDQDGDLIEEDVIELDAMGDITVNPLSPMSHKRATQIANTAKTNLNKAKNTLRAGGQAIKAKIKNQ